MKRYVAVCALLLALLAMSEAPVLGQTGGEIVTFVNNAAALIDNAIRLFSDADKMRDTDDPLVLFEGNDCRQNLAGSLPTTNFEANFKDYGQWFDNDEARSMLIRTNARRSQLALTGDPEGSDDEGYVRVYIHRTPPRDGVCVNTFERNYSDRYVTVKSHPRGQLDGKISYARVWKD